MENTKNLPDLSEIENIVNTISDTNKNIKFIKKERGLIERVDSSKIIITEDNRQLLND